MHIRVNFTESIACEAVLDKLSECPYIKLYTDTVPMPQYVRGCHRVHVGRVLTGDTSVRLWVVSDNIYRGAAWNVCEIVKQYYDFASNRLKKNVYRLKKK